MNVTTPVQANINYCLLEVILRVKNYNIQQQQQQQFYYINKSYSMQYDNKMTLI